MEFPGTWEIVLILLVIVVVFGAKRLPDSARALGRSMRILKAETKGLRDDDLPSTTTAQVGAPVVVHPVPQPQPVAPPQPLVSQPVEAQPYAGQQLFDAQGRPVAVTPVQPAGSQQVQPAQQASPQA